MRPAGEGDTILLIGQNSKRYLIRLRHTARRCTQSAA